MNNQFMQKLETLKIADIDLFEAIVAGYKTIFIEGVNDLKFVFNADDIIQEVINNIEYSRNKTRYELTIRDEGFEYMSPNMFKSSDLNIRWVLNADYIGYYDASINYIFIGFDHKYTKTPKNISDIVKATSNALIHELRHWYDHTTHDIESRKYTRLSQIENPELKQAQLSTSSFANDKYINTSTEINAYITEFIDGVLWNVFNKNVTYTSESLVKLFEKVVPLTGITKDIKKRLYKRLYLFSHAVLYLHTLKDKTTDELKSEMIKYLKKYTGIIESLDYSHINIMNNDKILIFEANYSCDNDYRNWFNAKYVKNDNCIKSALNNVINHCKIFNR